MKTIIRSSFKGELLLGFLFVAMVPLILSAAFLVKILENRINAEYKERVEMAISESSKEITKYVDDIDKICIEITKDADIVTGLTEEDSWLKNKAYARLYDLTATNRDAAHFDVYNTDGICVFTTSQMSVYEELPPYWGILKTAKVHPDDLIIRRVSQYTIDESICLQVARAIMNEKDECVGYIVASISKDAILNLLKNRAVSVNCVSIMDSYLEDVISTSYAIDMGFQEQIRMKRMSGHLDNILSNGTSYCMSDIENTGLIIAMGIEPILTKDIKLTMYTVMGIIAFASFVICIFTSIITSSYFTRPVKELSESMKKVEGGDLNVRVNSKRIDELGQLSKGFDKMTGRLQENVERELRHQKELNDSNIAMMQAQLNPHFLYNTLDTIKWGAKEHNAPELATLASALAGILRTSISGDSFITLEQELKLVNRYVEIQNIRFGGNIEYSVECPEELTEILIPKLILQPIVENAIIHGFAENKEGFIFVNIYKKDDGLHIDVEDNGKGMEEDVLKKLSLHDRNALKGHIGFYNVDTIIRLYYGNGYGLSAKNLKDGGCRVSMLLQIKEEKL